MLLWIMHKNNVIAIEKELQTKLGIYIIYLSQNRDLVYSSMPIYGLYSRVTSLLCTSYKNVAAYQEPLG